LSDFSIFANAAAQAIPHLPLVHTIDWFDFRTIKSRGQMVPELCDVYAENLLYFFYGRPSFRKHMEADPVSLGSLHLVSLIFDAATLPPPQRILPFDSGAFKGGLYDGDLHPGMELPHFELDPTIDAVARAVGCFYGSNKEYFRSKVRADLDYPCDQLEVESFVSIVASLRQSPADDRRSAIEVQIADIVDLTRANVLAVILPEQFLDHAPTHDYIRTTLGAEPIGYFCPHARPSEDARVIMNEAARFYSRRGWL
jgi:hypothetical protein